MTLEASKAYMPNLRPQEPFLHVEMFVVVGAGGWGLKLYSSVKLSTQA